MRYATRITVCLTAALLALLPFGVPFASVPPTAQAAEPGESLVRSEGTLDAGQTLTTQVVSGGAANLRLEVSGGAPSDLLVLSTQGGSGEATSWSVRSGETIWGYGTIAAGGRVLLQNPGSSRLSYSLRVYARSVAPAITQDDAVWSGVVSSAGTNSSIQLSVAASGMYRFTLGAAQGSYQLKVDDNAVLKTVVKGQEPTDSDSIYYLAAGVHTFIIVHAPGAPETRWSVALTPLAGSVADALPLQERSAVVGGPGFFREEWLPIQVPVGQQANLRIEATGVATDSLVAELYNGATLVYSSANVFGGEVAWASSTLAAGANRLHLVTTASNSAALSYTVTLSAVGQTPTTWSGVSYGESAHSGNSGRSTLLLTFPTSGLYQFNLSAAAGRYQLLLNNGYLQKTVSSPEQAEFTAYVAAGTVPLVVAQDPAAPRTAWSVAVAPTDKAADTLAFERSGSTLGGTANAFGEEWLPLQVVAGSPVNIGVVASGGVPSDSLAIELYNGETLVYTAAKIYSGETFWATAALQAGANRVHVLAAAGNSGRMSYQIGVRDIAGIPGTWQGVALKGGLNSTLRVNAPIAGTYDLVLTMTEGLGLILVDPGAAAGVQGVAPASSSSMLRVPLSAGLHTLVVQHDPEVARTVWEVAATLRRGDVNLALSAVNPTLVPLGETSAVTLTGQGFDNSTRVELVARDGSVTQLGAVVVSPTQIVVSLPASLPTGTFSVRLSSDGGRSTTMAQGLAVGQRSAGALFMPLIIRP